MVLDAIGGTSLVRLRHVVPPDCARIDVKLEFENPTGSMKDRAALAMIEAAEGDGRLRPGGTVVEYTGGSTGISLALVCTAKGYRLHLVTSDAFSPDKRLQMVALGAELTLVDSEGGLTTAKLIDDMIATSAEIAQATGAFRTDQLSNRDSPGGYAPLGEEILQQTGGRLDAFVQSVGTAASLRGTATVLKRQDPAIRAIAVEPAESAVLAGGPAGPHKIEGVGIGSTPPLWDGSVVDGFEAVSTAEAKAMTRRLAREEGLFVGTSSGANVLAAIAVGCRLGPEARVVTLMCDSGLKYLSTDVFREV